MTNVEALTKLAKAMGIPMPTETITKSIEYLSSEGNKFTDVIEATILDMPKTLIKISDYAPSKEEIENATTAQYIELLTADSDELIFTYGKNDGDRTVIECNGGCIDYTTAGKIYWASVCEDDFSITGVANIAEAPSKGFYIDIEFLDSIYIKFVVKSEKEGSMGDTIADVLNHMADNYPTA